MLTAGSETFYLLPCFSVQASQSCCHCLSSRRYVDWLPTQGCESQVTHHPCVCRVRIMACICSSAAGKSCSLPREALSWEASAEHPGRNHAVHSKVGWHRGLLESLAQCRVWGHSGFKGTRQEAVGSVHRQMASGQVETCLLVPMAHAASTEWFQLSYFSGLSQQSLLNGSLTWKIKDWGLRGNGNSWPGRSAGKWSSGLQGSGLPPGRGAFHLVISSSEKGKKGSGRSALRNKGNWQ